MQISPACKLDMRLCHAITNNYNPTYGHLCHASTNNIQLNLVDPNTVYPNYSVFRSVLSGPVYYPSNFNLKITP